MAKTAVNDDCAGTRTLTGRGWTEAAIRRFLGEPDRLAPNPVYRSAAPARLYSMARVTAAEATPEWQEWRRLADRRSTRGKAVADAKRAQLLAEVAALDIRVPVMDLDILAARAVKHRNMRNADRAEDRGWDADPADPGAVDEGTLRRWQVNFLRHACTTYDADLDSLYARTGRVQAAEAIRDRVYTVIAEAYPALAAEARRQATERSIGGTRAAWLITPADPGNAKGPETLQEERCP